MKQNILYPSRDPSLTLKRILAVITLLSLTSVIALQTTYAQDGASLHSSNCVACHAAMTGGDGSVLYTRDDRNVKSLDALSKQVKRCQSSLELNWTNDQVNSVRQYLNTSYYHF